MKKKPVPPDNKSIKTFLIYAATVFLLIIISLTIKAAMIIQQSKYDEQHFVVAIIQNNIVKEVVAFNPSTTTISLLKIKDSTTKTSQLGEKLAIATDGQINLSGDQLITDDITNTLLESVVHYNGIKTNLTIYDIGRLALFSKNVSQNNKKITTLPESHITNKNDYQIDKIVSTLFTDQVISSENTSIQIINASETSGIGKRLERVLVNSGANVVSVITSQQSEAHSKIEYFGKETYTLNKIKKLLQFTTSILTKETIADIVIIIGKDSGNTSKF